MKAARTITMLTVSLGFVAVSPAHAEGELRSAAQLSQYRDMERVVSCLLESRRKIMVSFVLNEEGLTGKKFISVCLETKEFRRLSRQGLDSDLMSGVTATMLLADLDLEGVEMSIPHVAALDHGQELSVSDLKTTPDVTEEAKVAWVDKVNWQRSVGIAAECIVREAPSLSRAVFSSDFGSSVEADAMGQLEPVMKTCLGADVSSPFIQAIRSQLAINFVRLATASDPSFKANLN